MPDWSALRLRARQLHAGLNPTASLVSAEQLLASAAHQTGVRQKPLAASDPLLSGALAVLDREARRIWYAAGRMSPEQQRFVLAHEYAHFWLHPEIEHDVVSEELADEAMGEAFVWERRAVGYSPAERRETEANLFAAEWLLPGPMLRQNAQLPASQIARDVGLTETCVRAQLTAMLSLRPADIANPSRLVAPQTKPPESDSLPQASAEPNSILDASQLQAAELARGPVLVDAGPGTGKTRTLVARLRHLLDVRSVPAENMLALTFSNKAAEEMRTRLRQQVGAKADLVWIGTFHAFGFELLRKEGTQIGLPVRPLLLDTADAISLLVRHLDRLPLKEFEYLHQPSLPLPDILRCISRAKDELKSPAAYREAAERQMATATDDAGRAAARKSLEIAEVYAVYQDLLREHGCVDFGDLLMRSIEVLDSDPEIAARWQANYPQVLADEYQDINRASAQLLKRLAGDGEGFWAVGDLRQAIYRFRGASPANVREFERDFPGGRRLSLEVNYRSRPTLVSLFGSFAQRMASGDERGASPWQANRSPVPHAGIVAAKATDEEAQASGIACSIREWERKGVGLTEQAVLCTTNAQAAELGERLRQRGIPAQVPVPLFEREEIKDLLAVLSLACEPEGIALARVAHFLEYSIPLEDVQRVLGAARETSTPFPRILSSTRELPDLTEQGRRGLKLLWSHLDACLYRGDTWAFLGRYLFEESRYLHRLMADPGAEAQLTRLAIERLLTFAQGFSRRPLLDATANPHTAFLQHIANLMQYGEARSVRVTADGDAVDGVRLMTIHQSKGLEFPVVYLPNLNHGQFPFRKPGSMARIPGELIAETSEEADADAETGEECLLFVALSRAREQLVLSRPERVRGRVTKPSPLLERLNALFATAEVDWTEWSDSTASGSGMRSEDVGPSVLLAGAIVPARTEIALPALEQYRECPRRYYYERVIRLPWKRQDSAYLHFHRCVQGTLAYLQESGTRGVTPTAEETKTYLEGLWTAGEIPEGDRAWSEVLKARAAELLEAFVPLATPVNRKAEGVELVAELPHGTIRLECDRAETEPDGSLRLTRYIKRSPKRDDHTDEKLALLRVAAQQRHPNRRITLSLTYLRDGEQRDVPENRRYEPARVEKYDQALEQLSRNEFPPTPDDQRCSRCPYFLVCPL